MNMPAKAQRAEIEAILGVGKSGLRRIVSFKTITGVLCLAAVGTGAWYYWRPQEGARLPYTFVTQPAARADMTVRVNATGTVQPTNKVDISSELSGVMRAVNVDYNSRVRKGDVLAELDTVKLMATAESSRARLSVARTSVRDAQVSLEDKRNAFERKKALSRQAVATQQDLDNAKAAYDHALVALDTAKANIEVAEAQVRLDDTNLARARIVSPIDGVVLMRKVDPGQTVASSLQAPVLFTIAEDLARMEIQVDVDEADVGRVREAQSAIFTVDAYPNRRFNAKIRMVRFGSEVVQGVVTYKAVLTTENNELLLRPGMTATSEIVVEQIKDALTVPNQALRFQPPQPQAPQQLTLLERLLPRPGPPQGTRPPSAQRGGGVSSRIFVLRDGQPVGVRVQVGASDGQRTQILKGDLQPDDAVIVDTALRRR